MTTPKNKVISLEEWLADNLEKITDHFGAAYSKYIVSNSIENSPEALNRSKLIQHMLYLQMALRGALPDERGVA